MKLSLKWVALSLVSFHLIAQAEDALPLDAKQMLLELKELQEKQSTSYTSFQKRNIDLVLRAASSKETAIAFYEEAQMATEFQGTNRENTQFRDWKKRQEAQLKDSDFRESVRLHLYYLALSLKCAAGAKPAELAPQVADYLRVLDASKAALIVRDSLLKVSVADGIFSKWLRLGSELAKAKEWEMNPGNADEIAAKFLLPFWRKQKNPALLTYWDGRIARATADAGDAKLDFQAQNAGQILKPELQWHRAEELIVLEQPNRAAQEMFNLIKNYPGHPKAAEWIAALEKLLKPAPATKPENAASPAPQ